MTVCVIECAVDCTRLSRNILKLNPNSGPGLWNLLTITGRINRGLSLVDC